MTWLRRLLRRLRPVKPDPAPQAFVQARPNKMKISPELLARSRAARRTPVAIKPFSMAQHPASVKPPAGMAMDDSSNLASFNSWAAAADISEIFAEGMAFLGYPALAAMAQRPEYRRISETYAKHMTRKWIELRTKSEGDDPKARDEKKAEKISAIIDELNRLNVQGAFQKAAEQDGFFGRGHLYLDTGSTDDREELKTSIGDGGDEKTKAKFANKGAKVLKAVRPVEAVWSYPTTYDSSDPLKDDWYNPQQWFVMAKEVHASRFLTFIGREVPDLLKPAYSFGGLSLSQMCKPYVDNWLDTRQSVNEIVNSFSQFVLSTNLVEALNDGGDALFKRIEFFNNIRNNLGTFAVDKNDEDFKNIAAPITGLSDLQAQSQEHMASAASIPIVLLLMITPKGLNASSEGELQAFYDWINACQEQFFRPHLTTIINLIQILIWGEVDPDIIFVFKPLWGLSELEESQVRANEAQTDVLYAEAGILHPEEVRERLARDPDSAYHAIDPTDTPELPDPSELVLEEDDVKEEPEEKAA